jgi:5S rRNA maturation endonuclease (ribonuclease M5)
MNLKRFKKGSPCPVCGGFDQQGRGKGRRCFGFLSEDGRYAHCTREEYANGLPYNDGSKGYAHLLGDCNCGISHNYSGGASRSSKGGSLIPTAYDYRDEKGELLYQVCRMNPKGFFQRRPDGNSGWVNRLDGVHRVLYRLPELLSADEQKTVYLCEGEKDCDALRKLGLVATTNSGGAEKWSDDYSEALRGRDVVILPDNDEAGKRHATQVAKSLNGIAASIKVVELPELSEHGDVSDWLAAGGTVEQLAVMVDEAEPFSPQGEWDDRDVTKETPKSLIRYESAVDLMARDFPEPKWAVAGLLSEGATVFAGAPKVGKSFMALGLALAIASGGRALSSIPVEQGDVLYLALEDGDKRMKKRLKAMLCGERVPDRLTFAYEYPRIDEGGLEEIERWLIAHPNARLIVVDTLKRIRPQELKIRRIYDNDYDAVSPLNDLAQRHGVSVLIVHHTNKLKGNEDWFDSISGSLGLSGAVDNAMLLNRPRAQQEGTLFVGGRDLEDKELTVEFDGVINGWKLIGDTLTPLARKVLGWLKVADEAGLSRSEINKKNGGRSEGVGDALAELKALHRADFRMVPTKGKAQERWFAANVVLSGDDVNDNDDETSFDFGEVMANEGLAYPMNF